ncbi:SRPBCC family protein [Flectobacillus major]|uniref:SRPBCC family protein n=1 Tax=Flectobacillus major TaxID=103 RepID=UPI000478F628|nr:SRPBCC family protein [Flectobacillus major]
MEIFTTIILGLLALIALLLLIALFLKTEYAVERSIIIHQPKQVVFDFIKLLKNQDTFSKWATLDPNMKKEYRGIDGTVGFIAAWDSSNQKVGKGEQEITAVLDGEYLTTDLRFFKPFDGIAKAKMETISISTTQTKVQWHFDSQIKYPFNLLLPLMKMDKMIGHELSIGLKNLKHILEHN